jgi:hypothetical protein
VQYHAKHDAKIALDAVSHALNGDRTRGTQTVERELVKRKA